MRLKLLRLCAIVLALALPVQGVAAITAGLCMAFGEHHGAGTQAHHSHADEGSDHSAHSHDHDADNAADTGADTDRNSHCGPCTACCASASIAGPAGIPIPSNASHRPYVFSQFPPLGVEADGLDRPPLAL